MQISAIILQFQVKIKHMNKHSLLAMASNANIPPKALALSNNVQSLRHLLYRAYIFGIFKSSFKRLSYDTETHIGAFFDFQPLYYNKFIEMKLMPCIEEQYLPYTIQVEKWRNMVSNVVIFSFENENECPIITEEMEDQLYRTLYNIHNVALKEMEMQKRYTHKLRAEKLGYHYVDRYIDKKEMDVNCPLIGPLTRIGNYGQNSRNKYRRICYTHIAGKIQIEFDASIARIRNGLTEQGVFSE